LMSRWRLWGSSSPRARWAGGRKLCSALLELALHCLCSLLLDSPTPSHPAHSASINPCHLCHPCHPSPCRCGTGGCPTRRPTVCAACARQRRAWGCLCPSASRTTSACWTAALRGTLLRHAPRTTGTWGCCPTGPWRGAR
jgi:hypothetical protein